MASTTLKISSSNYLHTSLYKACASIVIMFKMKSDLTNIMMIFFLPFAVKSHVDNHCRKNTRTRSLDNYHSAHNLNILKSFLLFTKDVCMYVRGKTLRKPIENT